MPVRLKSGAEWVVACRVFEVPEAELIRQAVTEAAVVQAIGRARAVNRTAENPVEVYLILHDTTVPVAATFPLEDWRAAVDTSLSGQARGKLLLLP